MAAADAAADSGPAPPSAMFKTNGLTSVSPTIAARAKRPASPNAVLTHVETSETATNDAAKTSAAVSSKGLAGGLAAVCGAAGAALDQHQIPPRASPSSASARR